MARDATMKNPFMEGLKAGWEEFLRPPKGFMKDLVTAALTGVSLFFVVATVKTLVPATGLEGFAGPLGGAAFVMSFTACSSWWQAVTDEFSKAFDAAKEHNSGIRSPELSSPDAPTLSQETEAQKPSHEYQLQTERHATREDNLAIPLSVIQNAEKHQALQPESLLQNINRPQ